MELKIKRKNKLKLLALSLLSSVSILGLPRQEAEASDWSNWMTPLNDPNLPVEVAPGQDWLPSVTRMNSNHPHYDYYRRRFGRNDIYLFLDTYGPNDDYIFYAPYIKDDSGFSGIQPNTAAARRIGALSGGGVGYSQFAEELLERNNYERRLESDQTVLRRMRLDSNGRPYLASNWQNISDNVHVIPDRNENPPWINGTVRDWNRMHFRRNSTIEPGAAWNITNVSRTPRRTETRYGRGAMRNNPVYGEWRSLGYAPVYGRPIGNPYFVPDYMREASGRGITAGRGWDFYPMQERPWDIDPSNSQFGSPIDLGAQRAMQRGDRNDPDFRIKRDAINRLLSENADLRTQAQREVGGNREAQILHLMPRLSMTNDPGNENFGYSAAFHVMRQQSTVGGDYLTNMIHIRNSATPPVGDIDLRIDRQDVIGEDGRLLQRFRRSGLEPVQDPALPGETVRVRTRVQNTGNRPSTAIGKVVYQHDARNGEQQISTNAPFSPGYTWVEKSFTIPTDYNDETLQINADIDAHHILALDITDHSDTNAYNLLDIQEQGNFFAVDTQLVNKDGHVIENPVPGTQYRMRYIFEYDGFGRDMETGSVNLSVDYNMEREMPSGALVDSPETETLSGTLTELSNGESTNGIQAEDGERFVFETDLHVFESTEFSTDAELTVHGDEWYDIEDDDNDTSNAWSEWYDISLDNVRVLPFETPNTSVQDVTALVQFDVDYDVPDYINDLGQTVDFLVGIDMGDDEAMFVEVEEHVRNGLNRNVTVPVELPLDGGDDRILEAVVVANPGDVESGEPNRVFESDYTNNISYGEGQIVNPEISGPPAETNTSNDWTQHYNTNTHVGKEIEYESWDGSSTHTFTRHTPNSQSEDITAQFMENYQIDAVWFRSRLSRELYFEGEAPEWEDGWVNLMDEVGPIRAGYGYELQIDVSYNTDAFGPEMDEFIQQTLNPTGIDVQQLLHGNNGNRLSSFHASIPGTEGTILDTFSDKWMRPMFGEPILQDNVYVQLPDGGLHSVDGDGGTRQSLRLSDYNTSEDGVSNVSWTFEIEGDTSLGAETVGRFYVGEDVTDGIYDMSVFTPRIPGVSGKMTSPTDNLHSWLQDSQEELQIQVIGANVDDVTDHINR